MNKAQKEWKENKATVRKKRIKLLVIGVFYLSFLGIFLYFFGYDASMGNQEKLINIVVPCIFLFILLFIFSLVFYKKPKYNPPCPNCGRIIYDLNEDCRKKIEYLGTEDRTTYEKVKTTIHGKTVYPRGGYSMRNSVMEHQSNSTMEMEQNIPMIKRYHIYQIQYFCKDCSTLIYSLTPLDCEN